MKRVPELEHLSSADKLIEFLQNRNAEYACLYQKLSTDDNDPTLISERYLSSSSSPDLLPFVLEDDEKVDADEFTDFNRKAINCSEEQNLMIAVAWSLPEEKHNFKFCTEVIYVDCTADTNNEERPLLTISAKNAHGKMFMILRAFLPNERAWIFRWIFSTVLPNIFGELYLSKVNLVISDGDSCEYTQLDIAIEKYMPNTLRIRCGWHLVDRGWNNYGPKLKYYQDHKDLYREISCNIKSYLYSWMKPNCETYDEYLISRSLLFKYLSSPQVMNTLGKEYYNSVCNWIRLHIDPHLEKILFCYRKKFICDLVMPGLPI